MEESRQDRRERRSRLLLTSALHALMQEKRFDTITVQDIIDRADVGRSTFYAHYRDKEDLLMSGFQEVLRGLLDEINDPGEAGAVIPTLRLFRHFQTHSDLYQALARGRALDVLYRATRSYLAQSIEQRILRWAGDPARLAVPLPIISEHVVGSLLNLTQWWFDNHMPYPPERMDEIFQRLVMPGLRAALADSDVSRQRL